MFAEFYGNRFWINTNLSLWTRSKAKAYENERGWTAKSGLLSWKNAQNPKSIFYKREYRYCTVLAEQISESVMIEFLNWSKEHVEEASVKKVSGRGKQTCIFPFMDIDLYILSYDFGLSDYFGWSSKSLDLGVKKIKALKKITDAQI